MLNALEKVVFGFQDDLSYSRLVLKPQRFVLKTLRGKCNENLYFKNKTVALIGSHTDCILQQLVVKFPKPCCFPAGRGWSSLLFYFKIGIGSLAILLAAWLLPPGPLAHAEHCLAVLGPAPAVTAFGGDISIGSQLCLAN